MCRLNGFVNQPNVRFCGVEGPDEHSLVAMNSHGVMAWFAIPKKPVIGPWFSSMRTLSVRATKLC